MFHSPHHVQRLPRQHHLRYLRVGKIQENRQTIWKLEADLGESVIHRRVYLLLTGPAEGEDQGGQMTSISCCWIIEDRT